MRNPVLWLELRIRIRERRLWVVTCLYLICLFAIAFISIMIAANEGTGRDPAQTGLTIFSFSSFSLMALLVILGPLASAGAITQEREQRTLPALLNTPLSPVAIVWGKLLAAWAFILWLASLSLPFLILGVVWGAVSWPIFFLALAVCIAAGMVSSTIAIGLSGMFRRSLTSYLATGAVMFLWLVVWPIFGALCSELFHGADKREQSFLFYTFYAHHVAAPLISLLTFETTPAPDPYTPHTVIPFALLVWTVLGAIFFALACRGLSRQGVSRNQRS